MEKDQRDKGFAWLILFFSFLCNILFSTVCVCPSVFLVNLTEVFDISTYQAGWIISMNAFVVSVGGVPAGFLIEKFGCKVVGFVGALLGCVSIVISSITYNIVFFILNFSVISGFFVSLTHLPPIVIIQMYFNMKRPFATGISQAGYSVGIFAVLPLIAFFIEFYGWRGALMIVGGICLNMSYCMLIYSSVNEINTKEKETLNKKYKCHKICDFSILKDITFLMVAFSFALFQFGSEMMFKATIPRAELDLNVSKVAASSIMSVMCIASVISRCICSVVANLPFISTLLMYAFSITAGGAVLIVSSFIYSFTFTLVIAALYGVTFGMAMTVQIIVLVDLLGVEKISRSQGIISGIAGVVYLVNIPFAGWIYDTLNSFSMAFFIAGIIQCAGGIIAFILLCKTRRKVPGEGEVAGSVQDSNEKTFVNSLDNFKLSPVSIGSIQSLSSLK